MTKRALLIGANYTATPAVRLNGCINDIVNMRNTLIDAYGYQDVNIAVLRDDDKTRLPTKANILAALNQVISASLATDTLWVHYSGHGTQIRDVTGTESDGLDECIVPCDYNKAGFIDDNTLRNIIAQAKCQIMLCFDSCHSGTVCDLQYSMNCANGVISSVVNNKLVIADTNIVMLSGSRDAQTSADAYNSFSQQGVGAFTISLLETLRISDHNIDLITLYKNLCANIAKSGFSQIPVLSSTVPNPSYPFARSNANGVAVVGAVAASTSTAAKKDANVAVDAPVFPKQTVSRKLNGLMGSVFSRKV
jgi:hypothetical protein